MTTYMTQTAATNVRHINGFRSTYILSMLHINRTLFGDTSPRMIELGFSTLNKSMRAYELWRTGLGYVFYS